MEVVDDLDGSPADQTVRFAFNGASYEIDLNRAHFEEFAEAIQPYIKAGRKVGSTRRRGNAGNPNQRLENAKIRAWAQGGGPRCFLIVVAFPHRLSKRTVRLTPDRYMSSGVQVFLHPRSFSRCHSTPSMVLFAPVSLVTLKWWPSPT